MDEKLIKILQKKDNHSINQYQRIEHLAQYMRKAGFNKNYKENVIKLITYYSYIKSIDTKGYRKTYVDAFSSYINKHYDEKKTKAYFEEKISENEFLEDFVLHYDKEKEKKQNKATGFQLIKKPIMIKIKQIGREKKPNLWNVKAKEAISNMKINIQYFLKEFRLKIPTINRKKEFDDWWNEYQVNLEEARKNDYDLFSNNKEKENKIKAKIKKNSISED